jgi:hypothetical protein
MKPNFEKKMIKVKKNKKRPMLYLHKGKVALFILPCFLVRMKHWGPRALYLSTSKQGSPSRATCSPTKQIPHQHPKLSPQLGCWEAMPLNWYFIDNPNVDSTTWLLRKPHL